VQSVPGVPKADRLSHTLRSALVTSCTGDEGRNATNHAAAGLIFRGSRGDLLLRCRNLIEFSRGHCAKSGNRALQDSGQSAAINDRESILDDAVSSYGRARLFFRTGFYRMWYWVWQAKLVSIRRTASSTKQFIELHQ